MKLSILIVACVVHCISSCSKTDTQDVRIAKDLLVDGVISKIDNVKILKSTDHLRENSYTIAVPTSAISHDVITERDEWKQVLRAGEDPTDCERIMGQISLLKAQKTDLKKVRIFYGQGHKNRANIYVVVCDEVLSIVVRDNL